MFDTPILLMAGGMFLFLVLVIFAFSGPSTEKAQSRRIEGLKARVNGGTAPTVEQQVRRISQRRDTKMDGIAGRFMPKPALIRERLQRTGKNWTLGGYMMVSLGIMAVVLIGFAIKGFPILLGLFLGSAVGLAIPHVFIGMTIKKRIADFTTRFPDAIELMVRGLRSGLPISETIGIVAAEVPGPTGQEFRNVADKVKIGRTFDEALQETADRLGTPEFQFFVITLSIQRETGGNLAETLANLAEVLRKRSQMKLKIKAMSAESKASAYIVGSLPFFVFGMIWTIAPDYIGKFFTDERLIIAGCCAAVWMSIGAFMMAKMVNFEI